MSINHILGTVVEQLTTELNNRFTEYGFKKRVKSKFPNLKLSREEDWKFNDGF